MERLNRGLVFWVLLFVSIALPLSAQKTVKKQLYVANVSTSTGAGVGTASITLSNTNPIPEYRMRSYNLPNQAGTKVSLLSTDLSWPGEIVLCENGGSAGDCAYDSTGNLDIEGYLVAPMFPPGVTGGMFSSALSNGLLGIRINSGSGGAGVFIRII